MRIAVIARVGVPILNDQRYGGIERIVKHLTLAYCQANHLVTLYAPHGSDIKHPNLTIITTTQPSQVSSVEDAQLPVIKRVVADSAAYDLIHSHIEPIDACADGINYFTRMRAPLIVTFHNQTYIDEHIRYYKQANELRGFHYVFVSENQRKPLLACFPHQQVIYNGIALDEFDYSEQPNMDQLAFLGRITPVKGIKEAILIASGAHKRLEIAASIHPDDRNYYDSDIEPLVDGTQVHYAGEVDAKAKKQLLGSSVAYLFPVRWQEPFGLTVVEALACGTPVIATAIGAMPELITHGKNGFLVAPEHAVEGSIEALSHIDGLDRRLCYESAQKFSIEIMTSKYLALLEQVRAAY